VFENEFFGFPLLIQSIKYCILLDTFFIIWKQ